jgi:hypothetical protein
VYLGAPYAFLMKFSYLSKKKKKKNYSFIVEKIMTHRNLEGVMR